MLRPETVSHYDEGRPDIAATDLGTAIIQCSHLRPLGLAGQRRPADAPSTLLMAALQLRQRSQEACGCADTLRRTLYRTGFMRPPTDAGPYVANLPQHRCTVRLYASSPWRCRFEQEMALPVAFHAIFHCADITAGAVKPPWRTCLTPHMHFEQVIEVPQSYWKTRPMSVSLAAQTSNSFIRHARSTVCSANSKNEDQQVQ